MIPFPTHCSLPAPLRGGIGRVLLFLAVLVTVPCHTCLGARYVGAMDNRADYPFVPGFTAQSKDWVTGGAPGGGLRLEWQADNETNPGLWTYTYRVLRGTARNKGFAFFDIETGSDFTAADIRGREVVSATDSTGAPIPSGLGSITISDPANFTAVHDFSNAPITETNPATILSKAEASHYSGDPGRVPPGTSGGGSSATPSVGPVPHPFYGVRVTFPGSFLNIGYEACAWEFRLVTDRVPMWGRFFGWGDQTNLKPYWYANFYNDAVDDAARLDLAPADSLTGSGPYRGWILVPGELPKVVSVSPADGAPATPVTEPVTAVFGGAMDPSTIAAATFTLSTGGVPVPGTVTYSTAAKTATFTPEAPLAPNTAYTAVIGSGAADLAGNAIRQPKVWTFTTSGVDGTAPAVIATFPPDGSTYVSTDACFSVTFDEEIDPSSIDAATFTLEGPAGPVAATVSWDRVTRNAVLSPVVPLAHNAAYTATVTTGVRDLAGNAPAAARTWTVRTVPVETVLPYVTTVSPADRAVNVSASSSVVAGFSEPVDPATVIPSTFFIAGVPGSVTYDAATQTATFSPLAPLAAGTTYTATVTTAVIDRAGNPLPLPKVWTFKTVSQQTSTFSASGAVSLPSGAPAGGIKVSVAPAGGPLAGSAQQTVVSGTDGTFSAAGLTASTYVVAPVDAGTLFVPRSIPVTVSGSNVTGLAFTAVPLTVKPDRPGPGATGAPVVFTADAVAGYEYRFYVNDGSGAGFVLQGPYGPSNTFSWVPPAPGHYDVFVEARGIGSSSFRDAYAALYFYEIRNALPPSNVTLTPNVSSPQAPGTPITFTAAATAPNGATGPFEYRFYLNDGSGSGFVLQGAYGPTNTFVVTPAAAGIFDVFVEARLAGTSAFRDAYAAFSAYQVQGSVPPTSVTVTPSVSSPQLAGTQVTFTAVANGTGPCEYRFYVNDGSGSGYVLQGPYSTINTFTLTPPAGHFDVFVEARTAGSPVFRTAYGAYYYYTIN